MKKILLLGGSRYLLPVIRTAHELGYYVITCDYLPDNIAHKYSDEYCNVSIIDKDAVLVAAEKLKIDGIMSFACDPGVVTAAYVAEVMGLPHCGSYESVCILQSKSRFRRFLSENGFDELGQRNVYARKYFYPAINEMSCYKEEYKDWPTPVAHDVATRVLTLPVYEELSLEDVDMICDIVLG